MLSVATKELDMALKESTSGQPLFNLTVEGESGKKRAVMIRELQTHPVSGNLLHADFYEFEADRKMNVAIPVVITGTAKGVEQGGLLQIIRREVEVLCRPSDIPDSLIVDITELGIGDSLHVEEIQMAPDVEVASDVNFTVVTVTAPKIEEPEEEEGEEEEGMEMEEGAEEEADQAGDEAEA
jgi:large subunit ribosomal protein L25